MAPTVKAVQCRWGRSKGSLIPSSKEPIMSTLADLPDSLKPLEREIATYRRELSRLLAEGHAHRYALIKGDQVVSIWDTFRDAHQAGRERFGFDPFLAQPLDPQDLTRVSRRCGAGGSVGHDVLTWCDLLYSGRRGIFKLTY